MLIKVEMEPDGYTRHLGEKEFGKKGLGPYVKFAIPAVVFIFGSSTVTRTKVDESII